jgi:hypothetical protein
MTRSSLSAGAGLRALAAQFPHDEEPRDIGLEGLLDAGDVNAPLLRSENQLDGINRTVPLASPMSDAVGGTNCDGLTASDADDVLLGTGGETTPCPNAPFRIDDGVEGGRDVQPLPLRPGLRFPGAGFLCTLPENEGEGNGNCEDHPDAPYKEGVRFH